jgi:uncharacterized protein YndB with AHSA1/START domain
MSSRSVVHASFTITRHWKASPSRVFKAFAEEEAKDQWFAGGDAWVRQSRSFDFREDGKETLVGKWQNGTVSSFDCTYFDIVPPSATEEGRIIYSYTMRIDGKKISVSQAAIQIRAENGGTTFTLTEYGDYLDGYDDAGSRERGTNHLMDQLEASLAG